MHYIQPDMGLQSLYFLKMDHCIRTCCHTQNNLYNLHSYLLTIKLLGFFFMLNKFRINHLIELTIKLTNYLIKLKQNHL